jgi:predicted metal-binding membrane protein
MMRSEYASRSIKNAGGLPLMALALSATIWVGLFAASTSGAGSRFYSSSMTPGSTVSSMLEFLGGWEVMVIAMMLPSSLGFLTLFRAASSDDRRPAIRRTAVCLGYALVWAAVGCVAMIVSGAVYRFAGFDLWLTHHSSLFAGLVLVGVGGFQFTTLKRRCLTVCSHPGSFLMRHYRRGAVNALDLGVRYGIACVGCCWALMILMVVLGAGSLYAMLALTAIMFAERALGWNNGFVSVIGLACVGLGALVAASPDAVPALAHNAIMWSGMESMGQLHGPLFWCYA